MELTLTKNNPKAVFGFNYNFSKFIIESFKVESLYPTDLPVINIKVHYNDKTSNYNINLLDELTDEMESPIFNVDTIFPLDYDMSMSIQRNNSNWISFDLEKGNIITIKYKSQGGINRIK